MKSPLPAEASCTGDKTYGENTGPLKVALGFIDGLPKTEITDALAP